MSQADGIFEEHRSALGRLAYRMLGSWADVDDMLQEAYLRWTRDSREQVQSPRSVSLLDRDASLYRSAPDDRCSQADLHRTVASRACRRVWHIGLERPARSGRIGLDGAVAGP